MSRNQSNADSDLVYAAGRSDNATFNEVLRIHEDKSLQASSTVYERSVVQYVVGADQLLPKIQR